MSDVVRSERYGRIAEVVLQRPAVLNAIDTAMAEALLAAFRDLAADRSARAIVIRGDGDRAFCAGADLKERATLGLDGWKHQRELFRAMFSTLRELPQPVIAAVHGFALGGGFELALLADCIVASEDAQFALPEARLGIIPGGNGVITLTRAVGPRRAKELLFSGRRISARDAQAIGIVQTVCAGADLVREAHALANEFARSSPTSLRAIKRLAASGTDPLDAALALEERLYQEVIASSDRAEGIAAFNDSREPKWSDD